MQLHILSTTGGIRLKLHIIMSLGSEGHYPILITRTWILTEFDFEVACVNLKKSWLKFCAQDKSLHLFNKHYTCVLDDN